MENHIKDEYVNTIDGICHLMQGEEEQLNSQ